MVHHSQRFLLSYCAAQTCISVFSARDKSERAFGVAFVKLMNPDGTTLQDGRHDLVVYKVLLREQGSENCLGNIYSLRKGFLRLQSELCG